MKECKTIFWIIHSIKINWIHWNKKIISWRVQITYCYARVAGISLLDITLVWETVPWKDQETLLGDGVNKMDRVESHLIFGAGKTCFGCAPIFKKFAFPFYCLYVYSAVFTFKLFVKLFPYFTRVHIREIFLECNILYYFYNLKYIYPQVHGFYMKIQICIGIYLFKFTAFIWKYNYNFQLSKTRSRIKQKYYVE